MDSAVFAPTPTPHWSQETADPAPSSDLIRRESGLGATKSDLGPIWARFGPVRAGIDSALVPKTLIDRLGPRRETAAQASLPDPVHFVPDNASADIHGKLARALDSPMRDVGQHSHISGETPHTSMPSRFPANLLAASLLVFVVVMQTGLRSFSCGASSQEAVQGTHVCDRR